MTLHSKIKQTQNLYSQLSSLNTVKIGKEAAEFHIRFAILL